MKIALNSIAKSLLLALGTFGFEGWQLAQSPVMAQEGLVILQPNEVDCNQIADNLIVQLPNGGVQSTQVFCEEQAERTAQPAEVFEAFPWSSPYWSGNVVCRERSGGLDVFCLPPDTAARFFFWDIPLR